MTQSLHEYRKIEATKLLSEKLELSAQISVQEWLNDLADRKQLKKVIYFYDSLVNADEKFILMEILVQVANNQL